MARKEICIYRPSPSFCLSLWSTQFQRPYLLPVSHKIRYSSFPQLQQKKKVKQPRVSWQLVQWRTDCTEWSKWNFACICYTLFPYLDRIRYRFLQNILTGCEFPTNWCSESHIYLRNAWVRALLPSFIARFVQYSAQETRTKCCWSSVRPFCKNGAGNYVPSSRVQMKLH